jgi:hypothetical protein
LLAPQPPLITSKLLEHLELGKGRRRRRRRRRRRGSTQAHTRSSFGCCCRLWNVSKWTAFLHWLAAEFVYTSPTNSLLLRYTSTTTIHTSKGV